jgi:hypothetical protein
MDLPNHPKPVPNRSVLDLFLALFERRDVDQKELDLLLPTHRNNWLRPQAEAKLRQLNPDDPIHRELHRLVTLCLNLFIAVDAERYQPGKDWLEIEPRLRRALAYFVKQYDAIPDHEPTGFDDDHREFRLLSERAELLLAHFEAHQPKGE